MVLKRWLPAIVQSAHELTVPMMMMMPIRAISDAGRLMGSRGGFIVFAFLAGAGLYATML